MTHLLIFAQRVQRGGVFGKIDATGAVAPGDGACELQMKKNSGVFLTRLVKGAAIGVAAILPGASGGVLAVAMGVYRPVLDAVTTLFKEFGKKFLFLLPLGLGGLLGLLATSRAVEWLMLNHRQSVMWALTGMVLGGLPSLLKEANARGFKARYLWGFVLGGSIIGLTALAQWYFSGGDPLPFNGWTAALGGALIGLGTVIPGISTSFIMIYLGIYEPFLAAFNNFNIPLLLCAAAGGGAVIVLLIALVKRLFDKHYGYAYYGAMGLLLVSVALIFPGFGNGWSVLLNLALFAAFFVLTYFLCRLPGGEDPLGQPDGENKDAAPSPQPSDR